MDDPRNARWQTLALERLHPGWLPALEPALVEAARSSRLGRRWLASRLVTVAPALFGRPPSAVNGGFEPEPPFATPPCAPSLVELGAWSLSSWWRMQVERQRVAQLHAAMGRERYERLLRHPLPREAFHAQDEPGRDAPPQAWERLPELLGRQGVAEWRQGLEGVSCVIVESLSLTVDPLLWQDTTAPRLRPHTVRRLLGDFSSQERAA